MKSNIPIIGKLFLVLSIIFSVIFFVQVVFQKKQEIYTDGANHIAFVLDVSQSMQVSDMDGYSRLNAAKQKIADIMSENLGYDFALSIFAGESQRVLPFTSDTSLFVTFLRGIDSNNLTIQGTNISGALDDAIKSFGDDKTGNIIILTDGDDEDIDISQNTHKLIQESETMISIIGVGSPDGGYIPNKIYHGERVKVGLNTSGLKKLAYNIGGKYYNIRENIHFGVSDASHVTKTLSEQKYILFALFAWIIYISTIYYALYYEKK